jgi:wyosine [tRNA(Phe)-imidazoG37] synthetase (radical SAM superfamily)
MSFLDNVTLRDIPKILPLLTEAEQAKLLEELELLETLKMSLQAINAISINTSKRPHHFWQLSRMDSLMVAWKL